MQIGKLDRRITIQSLTGTTNSFGEFIDGTSDYVTVWAGVKWLKGNERFEAEATDNTPTIQVDFTIRYGSNVSQLNNKHQILFDNNTFDILSIRQLGQRKEYLIITAQTKHYSV